MKATTTVWLKSKRNSWLVVRGADIDERTKQCPLALEIQGDDKNGYHLIMTPDGHFTADTWHETLDDAIGDALEAFGIEPEQWR